jgi:mRNA-degrading endonuclease toxin of MazEF toxin-antitoxin module
VSKRTYHPDRGDVIHINFAPSAGREFTGPHYGVVISPARFNRQTGLAICLPTTIRFHDHNLQMELPDLPELRQRGWVWVHQIKTMDYRERGATFVAKLPADFVVELMERTRLLIDPSVS